MQTPARSNLFLGGVFRYTWPFRNFVRSAYGVAVTSVSCTVVSSRGDSLVWVDSNTPVAGDTTRGGGALQLNHLRGGALWALPDSFGSFYCLGEAEGVDLRPPNQPSSA